MTKSNQSSLDIADHLSRGEYDWCPEAETRLREQHDLIRQQQAEIEALKDIVERLIGDWGDGFKNYLYQSDSYEENKLRDDVFAILRKARE